MSILASIIGFKTGDYVVTRRPIAASVAGKRVLGTATTFSVEGVIQPATDMQRVVGGKDMTSNEQNQRTDDVRSFYTLTEIGPRRPGFDPDMVAAEGDDWTVFRVEPWTISGVSFWMAILTKTTGGSS